MDRENLVNELKVIIEDYLESWNLELVDIFYRRAGRESVLKILVDKPEGGISLETCATLNNEIGVILDQGDLLKESYILEVSSPGIVRPLKTKNDFSRCIYRRVRVFLSGQIEGKSELEGEITGVTDASLFVETEKGKIEIPFSMVNFAKQIV